MYKNIKLFISSKNDGYVKIDNSKALSTKNTLLIELVMDGDILIEFYPIIENLPCSKALATFVKLSFSSCLKFSGENVELIRYSFDTYELVFLENEIALNGGDIINQKLLENGNTKIVVTVLNSPQNRIILQDESYMLSHSTPVLTNANIFSTTIGNNFFVCVEDKQSGYLLIINPAKNFDIAYEDTCSMLLDEMVIKKICFLDSKRRKSSFKYKEENGYFILCETTNENDEVNLNVPKNDILFTYLFIDSFVAGFENECMGYLSNELKDKIDFATLKEFLGDFSTIKQNIYLKEKDAPFVLVYQKENGYYTTAFLKVEIKDNLINNILVF